MSPHCPIDSNELVKIAEYKMETLGIIAVLRRAPYTLKMQKQLQIGAQASQHPHGANGNGYAI